MSQKQLPSERSSPREEKQRSRVSRRRASQRGQAFWDFVSNPMGSFSNPADRWWYVGIFAFALIGAIFGLFSLPDRLFDLPGLRVGGAVFFILGALLKAIINEIRATYYSRHFLLRWGIFLLTAIFIGAILGLFLLPGTMFVTSRIFWGACFGCIGLLLPTVLIRVFLIG